MAIPQNTDEFYVFPVLSTDHVEWVPDGEVYGDGKACFVNGKLRRWLTAGGERHYYQDGRHHRENGPAVERPSGRVEWFREGCCYAIRFENGVFKRFVDDAWPEEPGDNPRLDGPGL